MGSTLLALSLVLALCALAAVVRPPPGSRRGLIWFFLAFPAFHFTGELLIGGAIVLALCAMLGALRSAPGLAALAPGAVAAAALMLVRRRAHAAGATFEQALATAGWPPRRADEELAQPGLRRRIERSRNPLRLEQPGVERIADLSYGDGGVRNLLDLYRPVERSEQALPILLWIHGGAWILGHKRQQGLPLLYRMAKLGWLSVAINYRLGPKNRFPDPLVDVKRAIAWLRHHSQEYGGDPAHIVAIGGSAGGHLATLAALTPNSTAYQPGFENVDTALSGAVALYARFDFLDRTRVLRHPRLLFEFLADNVMSEGHEANAALWDSASPIALVGPSAPPMLVAHGTHDSLIPIAEASAFVEALRAVAREPVAYARIEGAQHAWDLFNTPWTDHTVEAVHAFASRVVARDRAARR